MAEKVQPGQQWRPPSAADQNAWSETAEDFIGRRRLSNVGGQSWLRTKTDIILTKNISGADCRKGEVLGVFELLVALDDEHIWLEGNIPGAAQGGFGILKRPTSVDSIYELQVSGVVIALVNMSDTSHGRAEVVYGDVVLASSVDGDVQILWSPGVTGEQECVVLLGSTGSSSACHEVRFQVVSADPSTRTALGEILSVPAGCVACDLPETTLGCTVIDICDPAGCFFNEPNEQLTGRQGWARYMMPITENICQPDPNYLVPQWEVFSLCCPIPECT